MGRDEGGFLFVPTHESALEMNLGHELIVAPYIASGTSTRHAHVSLVGVCSSKPADDDANQASRCRPDPRFLAFLLVELRR